MKVSDKGQISLPMEIQREVGIKKGDELLLIRKGQKIVLEKPRKIVDVLEGEFWTCKTFPKHRYDECG